jgi:hypothetical protein
MILLDSPACTVLAAAIALGFHLSVSLLQGLDFVPFWIPVLWVFFPDVQALVTGQALGPEDAWLAVVARGFEEEPCRVALSVGYLALQLITMVRFLDLREGKECLPLTCCPMFSLPRNLFGDEPRGGLLCEFDLRQGGHLDCAYNFYPWAKDLPMTSEDMKQIPGRMLMWMSTVHCDPRLDRLFQSDFLGQDLLVSANFDVPAPLHETLADLVRYLEEGSPEDWCDPAKVAHVLTLQQECHALFKTVGSGCPELAPQDCLRAGHLQASPLLSTKVQDQYDMTDMLKVAVHLATSVQGAPK